jgi:hypothetical protein
VAKNANQLAKIKKIIIIFFFQYNNNRISNNKINNINQETIVERKLKMKMFKIIIILQQNKLAKLIKLKVFLK